MQRQESLVSQNNANSTSGLEPHCLFRGITASHFNTQPQYLTIIFLAALIIVGWPVIDLAMECCLAGISVNDQTKTRITGKLEQQGLDKLSETVLSVMRNDLGLDINGDIRVMLSRRSSIDINSNAEPLTNRQSDAIGKYRYLADRHEIFVSRNVTVARTIRILGHELGHAYYEENYRQYKSAIYREGFAEWVSYKTLRQLGYSKEASAIRRRSDVYGQGLKIMLQAEKAGGAENVLLQAMK